MTNDLAAGKLRNRLVALSQRDVLSECGHIAANSFFELLGGVAIVHEEGKEAQHSTRVATTRPGRTIMWVTVFMFLDCY